MKRLPITDLRRTLTAWLAFWVAGTMGISALAADWPQWRCDAGRTAASSQELSGELHLQWVRRLPAPVPAWPKYPRLCFDTSYEPVVMGKTMFVPSMVTDSVTALATDTGEQLWRFYTDGPVRLAPVASHGKVYFVSDDGHLYCVAADASAGAVGKLLWKFRGLPAELEDRKVLGNDRLISLWPARGGPVLDNGTIYFAAGIWPFEGVFVYALDAESGKLVWVNKDCGLIEQGLTDHSTRQDSGLSPQGYLAVIGGNLFVPSGRALPGVLDRKTGELQPYVTGWGGRDHLAKGSWNVAGTDKCFFQSGDPYDTATRTRLQIDPANAKELGESRDPILTQQAVYFSRPVNRNRGYRPAGVGYERIVAWDVTTLPEPKSRQDDRGKKWPAAEFSELWSLESELKVHIKAGNRLYGGADVAGGGGVVAAVDLPTENGSPKVSWKARIEGTPSRILAAADKLFVVTRQGSIYAFGPDRVEPKTHAIVSRAPAADKWPDVAKDILAATDAKQGYCLMLGAGTGRLAMELARASKLHIVVIDPDVEKVAALRCEFDDAGLYGSRITLLAGDPLRCPLPSYFASLIVSAQVSGMSPKPPSRSAETGKCVASAISRAFTRISSRVNIAAESRRPTEKA